MQNGQICCGLDYLLDVKVKLQDTVLFVSTYLMQNTFYRSQEPKGSILGVDCFDKSNTKSTITNIKCDSLFLGMSELFPRQKHETKSDIFDTLKFL